MNSEHISQQSEPNFGNYFLQNKDWVDCWKSSQSKGHNIIPVISGNLHCYIYEYPWHHKKMWYIGKGPTIINDNLKVTVNDFKEFIISISQKAKLSKVVFVKLDINDLITNYLDLDFEVIIDLLKNNLGLNINADTSSLQYSKCAVLNLDCINKSKLNITLEEFVTEAKPLFDGFSESRRLQLKKVYKKFKNGELTLDESKTKENFEAFWETHLNTSARQGLTTNSKEYNLKMLSEPFTRLLVGYDPNGVACCGWFGVVFGDTMVYLLGGNNEVSLKNNWQHMLHLKSFQIAINEGLKFYDFGGFDSTKGYGQYKTRFNPFIRSFVEPIDLIINNYYYQTFNVLRKIKSKIKSYKE
jgi:lipid II:glycine glycyltransferase (peptidoglycan interpeptide bridge formation enzyme)